MPALAEPSRGEKGVDGMHTKKNVLVMRMHVYRERCPCG